MLKISGPGSGVSSVLSSPNMRSRLVSFPGSTARCIMASLTSTLSMSTLPPPNMLASLKVAVMVLALNRVSTFSQPLPWMSSV